MNSQSLAQSNLRRISDADQAGAPAGSAPEEQLEVLPQIFTFSHQSRPIDGDQIMEAHQKAWFDISGFKASTRLEGEHKILDIPFLRYFQLIMLDNDSNEMLLRLAQFVTAFNGRVEFVLQKSSSIDLTIDSFQQAIQRLRSTDVSPIYFEKRPIVVLLDYKMDVFTGPHLAQKFIAGQNAEYLKDIHFVGFTTKTEGRASEIEHVVHAYIQTGVPFIVDKTKPAKHNLSELEKYLRSRSNFPAGI